MGQMEPCLQNFFQIFFHSSHAALYRAPDNALVNALLPGDLAVAFAEDQMRFCISSIRFMCGWVNRTKERRGSAAGAGCFGTNCPKVQAYKNARTA